MIELSETDRRILMLLQADGRLSTAEIASRANLSPSACWRRVKALEDAGVIRGTVALVDAERAGLRFSAVVHVTLTRHDASHVEAFISRVVRRPEVLECLSTTGDADYHLRVVCEDKDAYNRFLEEFLFLLPGIAQVKTNLVLKEIKLTTALPVGAT
jgi:Lrp/AsnC family transcriptional regulator, leucine-responsive regulatory protein